MSKSIIPFSTGKNRVGNKSQKSTLNNTKKRILSEIRNNPNITKLQLIAIININKSAIDKAISELKRGGYIKRVGGNKMGCWVVVVDEF